MNNEQTEPGRASSTSEYQASSAEGEPILDDVSLGAKEIAELKEQAAKAKEHWDQLLRMAADFENYKKRATRERQDALRYSQEPLLKKLVGVLDNFDMALAATSQVQDASVKSLQTGVAMIHHQLKNVLSEAGLEEIDAAGQPFDPAWHEAVAEQETSEIPEGHVLQQTRKGYKLRDRLLRPAGVVVAKKPA